MEEYSSDITKAVAANLEAYSLEEMSSSLHAILTKIFEHRLVSMSVFESEQRLEKCNAVAFYILEDKNPDWLPDEMAEAELSELITSPRVALLMQAYEKEQAVYDATTLTELDRALLDFFAFAHETLELDIERETLHSFNMFVNEGVVEGEDESEQEENDVRGNKKVEGHTKRFLA